MIDPRTQFPLFYDNPAICALAPEARWTISGQIHEDTDAETPNTRKAPIDLRCLLDDGRLRGAWATDAQCLVTLDELTQAIPAAANTAFFLTARTDGLIVIDIEPSCPPEVAASLLALPDAEIIYRELSMSGRGYHLIAPLPANFYEYPLAAGKRVLREEHGWYEILLTHWVTFTRTPIPASTMANARHATDTPFASVAELYQSLAEKVTEASAVIATAVHTDVAMPEIAYAETIVDTAVANSSSRLKTLKDFNGDHSRWEFSTLATLYRYMQAPISERFILGEIRYSDSDRAWLLFQAARKVLPARPKHQELRNGRPFLLDRAASLIAQRNIDKQEQNTP